MSADFEPMVPRPRLPEPPEAEPPSSLSYPFWSYEDLALFFGLGLPCLVLSLVAVEVALWAFPLKLSKAVQVLSAQFVGYGLWFTALIVLLRLRYEAPFWKSLAWTMPKRGIWSSLVQGPILAFVVAWLGLALRTPNIDIPFKDLLSDQLSITLTGIFAVTVGPVCEELAFRGFLMPVLMRTFGAWGGILITALPFALLHGPQYSWSWRHLLLLVLAGAAFGRVRLITGSTVAAALTHATYNLTFFSALVAQGKDWQP
jgi:hypothetical protein